MIRNEVEYRNSKKQVEELSAELENFVGRTDSDATLGIVEALRTQIGDIERQIAEYEALKAGRVALFEGVGIEEIGKLLIKGRVARNWSQADLGKALGMEPQQVQRYERNDWQRASLWRLQEVADALELDVKSRAKLREERGELWVQEDDRPPVVRTFHVDETDAAVGVKRLLELECWDRDDVMGLLASESGDLIPARRVTFDVKTHFRPSNVDLDALFGSEGGALGVWFGSEGEAMMRRAGRREKEAV